MKQALVLHVTDEGWRALPPGRPWFELSPWSRLDQPAVVVLDLEQSHTDVWRFEGKPEYAAALIEKRVRTEGLVDGSAHVVVHKVQAFPSGFQAFFSAMPLDVWQQASTWAAAQQDHCVLLHAAALLADGLPANGARALVGVRGWSALVQAPSGLAYFTARVVARSSGDDAYLGAARLLAAQWAGLGSGVERVQVGVLGLEHAVAADALTNALAQATGVAARTDHIEVFQAAQTAQAAWQSSLPALALSATRKHVLNPGLAKLAWQAESWVGRMTVVVALVAATLMGAAWYAQLQTQELRAQSLRWSQETAQVEQRLAQLGQTEPSPVLVETAEFARKLDEGRLLDPMRLLSDLQRLTSPEVRVQRLRLQPLANGEGKAFRVEGQADLADSAAVMRWVRAMEQAGWRLRAIDPTDTVPGAWAYEVTRQQAVVKPEGRT